MYNISICIPTYKREDMLKQLLDSIKLCRIDESLINEINIVVVDNDVDKTAEKLIGFLKKPGDKLFQLHYNSYAVKGLANVRNELIDIALQFKPDFIVFIDDDEFVTENWLNELLITIIANNADAARGPVFTKLMNSVPKSVDYLLKRENYKNNTQLATWTTGNLILRRTSLEKYKVRFDKRFNSTGSEDTFFGRQMAQKGATIFWAANAIAYEMIPEKRTKINWFIARAYRGAGTYIYILKLEKEYLKIANKVLISIVYILFGLFTSIFIFLPYKEKYWGVLKIADGIGALAGLFNFHYNEYE